METWSTVVAEIMRIHRFLPSRPAVDEIEAAKTLILNVEKEDQARLDSIVRQSKSLEVPEELFIVLQEMQRNSVYFLSNEQRREPKPEIAGRTSTRTMHNTKKIWIGVGGEEIRKNKMKFETPSPVLKAREEEDDGFGCMGIRDFLFYF